MQRKILLDTDIGSDIDDAVCLAYLLAHPECDLLGITTVTGQPVQRARLASALCRAAGRDVPIFPGVDRPLLVPQQQPEAPQAEALTRWDHARDFRCGEAIEFLRRTIHAHPGEVTLLAVGPLTNIGLLFATDPEAPGLLRELVLMCGVFTNRLAGVGPLEWNAIGDPHATALVYRAPVKVHRSIGLDVTCQVQLEADEVRRRFRGRYLRPVLDFAEVWFRGSRTLTFHDPLAATTLFDDSICTFAPGHVEVELASNRGAGQTWWRAHADGPHQVALQVSPQRFFDHYLATTARDD
jgi:inosine-uridine nucleoside N-ribohydrolase